MYIHIHGVYTHIYIAYINYRCAHVIYQLGFRRRRSPSPPAQRRFARPGSMNVGEMGMGQYL